jgi:hypothetical protein
MILVLAAEPRRSPAGTAGGLAAVLIAAGFPVGPSRHHVRESELATDSIERVATLAQEFGFELRPFHGGAVLEARELEAIAAAA